MVMANEIAHQDIKHVVIDADRLAEMWHDGTQPNHYTDKRTVLSRERSGSLLDGNGDGLLRWETP